MPGQKVSATECDMTDRTLMLMAFNVVPQVPRKRLLRRILFAALTTAEHDLRMVVVG